MLNTSDLAGAAALPRLRAGLGWLTVALSLLFTTAALARTPASTSKSSSTQVAVQEGGAKAGTSAVQAEGESANGDANAEPGDPAAAARQRDADSAGENTTPQAAEGKFQYDDLPSPPRALERRHERKPRGSYHKLVAEREALLKKRKEHGVGAEVTTVVFGGLLTLIGGMAVIYSFGPRGTDQGKGLSAAALGGGGLLLGFGISNLRDELRERRKYKQKIDKIDERLHDARVEVGFVASASGAALALRGTF